MRKMEINIQRVGNMKIQSFFALLVLLVLAGCSSLYKVEKDVPISMSGLAGKSGQSGRTKTRMGKDQSGKKESFEFFTDDNDLFILKREMYGENQYTDGYYLIGVTKEHFSGCSIKNLSEKQCRERIIEGVVHPGMLPVENDRLTKVKGDGSIPTVASTKNLYVTFKAERDPSEQYFVVEYIDYSKGMLAWKDKYREVQTGSIDGYFKYANQYPGSPHAKPVMRDMFAKFFSVKIVGKNESPQRATRESGLVASAAGSCKNIARTIEIKPTTTQLPSHDITLDVRYILRRTYSPYIINEKDDPLYLNKTYVLGKGNSFHISDEVTFDCVPTAMRIHGVVMSLAGKLLGMKEKDTGINITLTNIGFDFDLLDVK